jgi:hypothetical protein
MKTRFGEQFQIVAFLLCLIAAIPVMANDSAASTALGGVQLTREPRVSMQKERLFISQEKVRVEYEFLNETNKDITTQVAFPIPPYRFDMWSAGGSPRFDDFRLWVDGRELRYQVEAKALLHGKDYTAALKVNNIDVESFGHFNEDKEVCPDFVKLPVDLQRPLTKTGLFDSDTPYFPQWSVVKTYHWTQIFPAHKVVRIAHEYKPAAGYTAITVSDLDPHHRSHAIAREKEQLKTDANSDRSFLDVLTEMSDSCVDESLRAGVVSAVKDAKSRVPKKDEADDDWIEFVWVDYILTTANSWKTPIKNFELVIEKPEPLSSGKSFVSFCWGGHVEKVDDRHFVVRAKNFVPRRELHVAFFY